MVLIVVLRAQCTTKECSVRTEGHRLQNIIDVVLFTQFRFIVLRAGSISKEYCCVHSS